MHRRSCSCNMHLIQISCRSPAADLPPDLGCSPMQISCRSPAAVPNFTCLHFAFHYTRYASRFSDRTLSSKSHNFQLLPQLPTSPTTSNFSQLPISLNFQLPLPTSTPNSHSQLTLQLHRASPIIPRSFTSYRISSLQRHPDLPDYVSRPLDRSRFAPSSQFQLPNAHNFQLPRPTTSSTL